MKKLNKLSKKSRVNSDFKKLERRLTNIEGKLKNVEGRNKYFFQK